MEASMVSFFIARRTVAVAVLAMTLPLAACGDEATLSEQAGSGPNPKLPEPKHSWFPTVHIAPAKGWPAGETPKPESGFKVAAFATGLEHPRWLYKLPNGDILVAESNAPAGRDDNRGLKNWVAGLVMGRA
jgi:glucose/arabinose dehydrogenase